MQRINCVEPTGYLFSMCENTPSIAEELFWSIILACPKDGVILELGSGATTALIAQHRKIYSIEDNPQYVGKYNKRENYIYAPQTKDSWYMPEALRRLPEYDVLFIDGPAHDNRMNVFARNMNLFDTKAHWFFDDTAHAAFEQGLQEVQRKREKTLIQFDKCMKKWGVIIGD
jgi:hypothetical protein